MPPPFVDHILVISIPDTIGFYAKRKNQNTERGFIASRFLQNQREDCFENWNWRPQKFTRLLDCLQTILSPRSKENWRGIPRNAMLSLRMGRLRPRWNEESIGSDPDRSKLGRIYWPRWIHQSIWITPCRPPSGARLTPCPAFPPIPFLPPPPNPLSRRNQSMGQPKK